MEMDHFDNTANICRICLIENNEKIQSVFDTIDSPGDTQQFSEILMAFAKVEIFLGDELPDQICPTCAQTTVKLHQFKLQCQESDAILRKRFKEGPFIDINKIDTDEEDIFDKIKLEIKDENDVEQNANDPLDTIVDEDYNANTSPKSSESFNIGITIDSTLSIAKESDAAQENDKVKKLYKCDVCKKKLKSSRALGVHKRIHTGETPYECNICAKKFKQLSTVISHKRTHTDEKLYECGVCGKKFKLSSTLGVHKRMHTGETPYKCGVCGKKFKHLNALVGHKRIHTGEKPYECNICAKKFKQSSTLVSHKRTHTGEKPYECGVCQKKFTQLGALGLHKRTHTGEKPYECGVCERKFTQLGALENHKRTHADKKVD